jgi:hypothetical protein
VIDNIIKNQMESRERRKASRHLRRAQELLNHQLFGFGVGPDKGNMASETRVPKRSNPADESNGDTEPKITIKRLEKGKNYYKKYITVTQYNAIIRMSVPGKKWEADSLYPTLDDTFTSDLHILGMYAAPVGKRNQEIGKGQVTKRLLCYGLKHLIDNNFEGVCMDSVVSAEVDQSPEDNLINKVYRPMGFKLRARMFEDEKLNKFGGLMTSTVKDIMAFCER